MKSTKFQLDFKSFTLKMGTKESAAKAGKTMNQYILDCINGFPQVTLVEEGLDVVAKDNIAVVSKPKKKKKSKCECLMAPAVHNKDCKYF